MQKIHARRKPLFDILGEVQWNSFVLRCGAVGYGTDMLRFVLIVFIVDMSFSG